MPDKKELTGYALAFMTVMIWGMTFISTKVLLQIFTPIEILFLRFSLGFIVLCLFYPHPLKLKERKQEWYFIGAGICGVTLYFLFENIALVYTRTSNVGVIISIAPFFTALFAHFFLKEKRIGLPFFAGAFLAFIGICLLSFSGGGGLDFNLTGDLLAVLAALVWAMYSIFTKKISEFQYNTIQTTRRIFFYGLLFMIPVLYVFGFEWHFDQLIQPLNLFNLLFLGLGASALCFVTWNVAVKDLGPVKTSVYIYMVPVITVLGSVLILHEKINLMSIIGIVFTLIGLVVSEMKPQKSKQPVKVLDKEY